MDVNPNILTWTSESTAVPYRKPTDQKYHRYFVDFACSYKEKCGNITKLLIEYKPLKFVNMPIKTQRMSDKTYINLCETWSVNRAKWKAAEEFAKQHNAKFIVITEKDIGM